MGAAAGVGLVPTISSGKEDSVVKFDKAMKNRDKKDWSLDKWFKYIDDKDIEYGNEQKTTKVDLKTGSSTDGPSTQIISGFEEKDLTLTMTYYSLGSYDAVELHWSFDNSGIDDAYTGKPKDIAKIGYNPDHYSKPPERDGESWYSFGSDMVELGKKQTPEGGAIARYNGLYFKGQNPLIGDGEVGGDLDLQDYMTLYIDPDTSVPLNEREIYFSYSMLYDSASLGDTNISDDGISFGITNEEDSWTVSPAYEQEDLRNGKQYTPN
ncbi:MULTISPECIES: hypothetical protein [unclassified Haloferax]|uniref:hypothetical protein n=1 Tax=unclassified Haloferax TaxID=2625095 RepID=UPI0012677792|nr:MULTISPECIES: hypothetical protein [unclassified Haloferax]